MILRLLTFAALIVFVGLIALPDPRRAVRLGGQTVTLEMSVWGMPWENDLYTKVYIPEFERQNPGIKVKFHHFEDYPNRVLLSHAGGIAPDVSRQNLDFSMGWIRRGMNLPLDEFMDGPDGIDREDFIPIIWEGLQHEGKTYGIPQDINLIGLFYNKDLFDKEGLAYPTADWTWADLKEAAEKLTKDEDGDGRAEQLGLDFAWNAWSFRPFIYQAGGQFWNEEGDRAAFDTPEVVEALTFFKSLMKSYSFTQSSSQRGGLGPDKFFESGKVALYLDGSWRTPSLVKNAPNLNFAVAPLPRGQKAMSVSGSCYWAVSSQTRHPKEAWKLAKFLSSKEALEEYWSMLWVAPPARWSALRSPRFREVRGEEGKIPGLSTDEDFQDKAAWIPTTLENGWTTVELCSPYLDRLMLHLSEEVERVLLENKDPGKALREAADKTNKQIAEAQKVEALARGGKG